MRSDRPCVAVPAAICAAFLACAATESIAAGQLPADRHDERQPPSTIPAPTAAEIVVTGARMERSTAHAFVESVVAETGNGQVARWDDRICLNLRGLSSDRQGYFAERIAAVGARLGLRVEDREGCEPAVYVIFTPQPSALLATLEADRPYFFGSIDAGDKAAFLSSPAPVRWLSHAQLRGADGEQPMSFTTVQNPMQGSERPAPGTRTTPSRLRTGFRMDLQAMIVVVDTSKIRGVSFGSLSAYLSAVIFGNPRPDMGDVGVPSILRLFEASDADPVVTADLTEWDTAYLGSLYRGSGNVPARQRIAHIAASMARDADATGDPE